MANNVLCSITIQQNFSYPDFKDTGISIILAGSKMEPKIKVWESLMLFTHLHENSFCIKYLFQI